MTRAVQPRIILRIVIDRPVAGVAHSLQTKKNQPQDVQVAAEGRPLEFDVSVRLGPNHRLLGEFVRTEGPERRFVYIAIGQSAGQTGSVWTRRMKIDVHTIPETMLDQAAGGRVLSAVFLGAGKDGTPACASVRPLQAWSLV